MKLVMMLHYKSLKVEEFIIELHYRSSEGGELNIDTYCIDSHSV